MIARRCTLIDRIDKSRASDRFARVLRSNDALLYRGDTRPMYCLSKQNRETVREARDNAFEARSKRVVSTSSIRMLSTEKRLEERSVDEARDVDRGSIRSKAARYVVPPPRGKRTHASQSPLVNYAPARRHRLISRLSRHSRDRATEEVRTRFFFGKEI